MKKLLRQFHYGGRGFTLVELLVVVAILGVLAAVIVPNVGKFMGTGTVQAANTEAHNVQTAVLAYMADNSYAMLEESVDPLIAPDAGIIGPVNDIGSNPPDISTVKSFITGDLQADYTISRDGSIAAADVIANSKWGNLSYTAGVGWAAP